MKKKIYVLLIAVAVTTTGWSQVTRQWAGLTASAPWNVPANWVTVPGGAPGVPAAGDRIVFNGVSVTVTGVPTISLGGLTVENSATIILASAAGNRTITIADGANAIDFDIKAGSVLSLDGSGGANGVNISLKQNDLVKASIAGEFIINAGREYEANLNGVNTDVTGTITNRSLVTGNTARLHFLAGSTYVHDLEEGDIPDATWDVASTCRITGSIFNGPRFLNRTFGNFVWDNAGQKRIMKLAASGMTVGGTLSVVNTGESRLEMDQASLTVGNFELSGGIFKIASTIGTFLGQEFQNAKSRTMNTTNMTVSGGTLLMTTNESILQADAGTINITGNVSLTGGTITETGGQALTGTSKGQVRFTGTSVQTFTKAPAAIISETIDFTINSQAKVNFGTSVLNGSTGQFTLTNGGKIITSNANGLSTTGTIQMTNRVFGSGADYEFRGASTGAFTTSGGQVRDLIIDNIAGQVMAARAFEVNGALILTNGYLTTSTTNSVLIALDGSATTINGAFVNGRLSKRIRSTTKFTFPVGKAGAGLRTIGITPSSLATTTFTAEFMRAAAPTAPLLPGLHNVSNCEYWNLERNGTADARVTLSWEPASGCSSFGYVKDRLDLRVAHLTGGSWKNEGNFTNTGSPASGTVTSNVVTTFSPFALGSATGANPLPVIFADVKAYEKNDGVQLEWSNLTEENVALYTIERSANGRDFTAIGTQVPTSNQNNKASYTGFDAAPAQGTNYYRIKAQETTGKIVYTQILSVVIGQTGSGLRLYPNPVTGNQVTISLSNVKRGQYNLQVINVTGQEIMKQLLSNQSGSMTQQLNLPSTVKPGVYNLIITGDDYRENKTFIVQ